VRIGIGALVGIVGGPATYARELVAGLARAGGHEYVVFTDRPDAFAGLGAGGRLAILEFLDTLVLFPPDDTASNLDPGNPAATNFPQFGHGSIKLAVLFNDPSDPE